MTLRTLLGALALTAALLGVARADAEPVWHTRYDDAVAAAREAGRPILANFTGSDWCGWCKKLKAEVFDQPAFREWAAARVVLLEVDFPRRREQPEALRRQNEELAERHGVEGFPTVVLLSADGDELARAGYEPGGAEAWTAKVDAALAAAAKPAPTWGTDFEAALREAKRTGRPILANFTGSDWCGWCKKLKAEVFDLPAFREWAAERVVLLEVDFPRQRRLPDALAQQNERLLRRYGVRGFPTVLLLDGEGKRLGELGYLRGGVTRWTEAAQALIDAQ